MPRELPQARHRHIRGGCHGRKQPALLSIFGDVRHARGKRVGRRSESDGPAVKGDGSSERPDARQSAHRGKRQRGATRTHQASQPHDLPFANAERCRLHPWRGGRVLHVEHKFSDAVNTPGKFLRHVASHHRANQFPSIDTVRPCGDDVAAVAQDGDAICDRKDLVQPVRDINDAQPALSEPPKRPEQPIHFRRCERGGGLV